MVKLYFLTTFFSKAERKIIFIIDRFFCFLRLNFAILVKSCEAHKSLIIVIWHLTIQEDLITVFICDVISCLCTRLELIE